MDNHEVFSSILDEGTIYLLEVTAASDPAIVGMVQEIVGWTSNTITTEDDLVGLGLAAGDSYQIRPAMTVQKLFGEFPELISGGNAPTSDVVWLPAGNGNFVQYFYRAGLFGLEPTWFNATDSQVVTEDIPCLLYTSPSPRD